MEHQIGTTTGSRRGTQAAWYTADLGYMAVEFAVPLYLTPWVVTNLGVSAVIFGLCSALSSWLVAFSGPYIGVRADEQLTRRRWYGSSALVGGLLMGSLFFLPHHSTAALVVLVVFAMVANYFFQLSGFIYNASMHQAAGKTNIVTVSAIGYGIAYLGGVAGILVIKLVFADRLTSGGDAEGLALSCAALLFLLTVIPGVMSRGMWPRRGGVKTAPQPQVLKRMLRLWKQASVEHEAGWLLAGYFAMNSAIMGFTLYLPLHLELTTTFSSSARTLILGAAVLSAAVGAGATAAARPSMATVRWIFIVGLSLWMLNAFAFGLVTNQTVIVALTCIHGLLSGPIVSSVRGVFSKTFGPEYQALAFGLFGATSRLSLGLGAALWPIASSAIHGPRATSIGIAAMGVVAAIAIPFLWRWRPWADDGNNTPALEHPADALS